MSQLLSLPEFVARWRGFGLSERSAAQQHFLDLCQVLGQPTPATADPTGSFYTFEKGVAKTGGGKGFAGVLRVGVQGAAPRPRRRVPAAPAVPRGPGEPAPARGVRP